MTRSIPTTSALSSALSSTLSSTQKIRKSQRRRKRPTLEFPRETGPLADDMALLGLFDTLFEDGAKDPICDENPLGFLSPRSASAFLSQNSPTGRRRKVCPDMMPGM